jgi:hypothetical protein
MASRFISNLVVLIAGSFLVTASFAFGSEVLGWVGLAAGCVILLTVLVAFAVRGRGIAQRALDACVVLGGAWSIVAARSFTGGNLKWLTFSEGAMLAFLAVAGLIVHEVQLELCVRRAETVRQEDGRVTLVGERTSIGVAR